MRTSRPTIKEEPTEQSVQQRLNHFFASWKYNVDGLYVFGWESDKLIWTKTGYIYEFEIKISRQDFKNDFKHKKDKHIILQGPTAEEKYMPSCYQHYEWNKKNYASLEAYLAQIRPDSYDLIANNRKPNYFYYAVPEGMIQPEEVPEYAGLIWIQKEYRYVKQSYVIVKQAPQLHKVKYKDAELNLSEKFYYNWQADRRLRKEAQKERDLNADLLREKLQSKNQEYTYSQIEGMLASVREERDEYYQKYYDIVKDQKVDKMMLRRMGRLLKQLNPDFDYFVLETECMKDLGIKT